MGVVPERGRGIHMGKDTSSTSLQRTDQVGAPRMVGVLSWGEYGRASPFERLVGPEGIGLGLESPL